MAKKQANVVLTASRTQDGAPVYWAGDGHWVTELGRAAVYPEQGAAALDLDRAQVQERLVCDPYLMPAAMEDGVPRPVSARELIRSSGPTSRVRRPDPSS